jgi:hypothetical protein
MTDSGGTIVWSWDRAAPSSDSAAPSGVATQKNPMTETIRTAALDVLQRTPVDVAVEGAFAVEAARWRGPGGADSFAVACKATFRLEPVVCPVHHTPEAVTTEDTHSVPPESRAAVIVVGSAGVGMGRTPYARAPRAAIGSLEPIVAMGPGSEPLRYEIDALLGDERLVLENLHPSYNRLDTRLPGVRPSAVLRTASAGSIAVVLRADTLVIDAARGLTTLLWRGRVLVPQQEAPARFQISLIHPGSSVHESAPPRSPLSPGVAAFEPVSPWAVQRPVAAPAHPRFPDVVGPAPSPAVVPAAAPVPSPAVQAAPSSALVELVWHEPEVAAAVRRSPIWSALPSAQRRPSVTPRPSSGEQDTEARRAAKDIRDLLRVLQSAEADDASNLSGMLRSATVDGLFVPPLVIVEGDLEPLFSPHEILQATLAAVAPFTTADADLKQVAGEVRDVLSAPGVAASRKVLDTLIERLRKAFGARSRDVEASYLEETTTASLVENRKYDLRKVLGTECLRASLHPRATDADRRPAPIPIYIPAEAGEELPLARRWPARVVAELRSRADESEPARVALRARAIGRRFDTGEGSSW